MINPTSPQLWHRMRVKSGGTARTECAAIPAMSQPMPALVSRSKSPTASVPISVPTAQLQVVVGYLDLFPAVVPKSLE